MKRAILALGLALVMVSNLASATPPLAKIDALGPGSRIHGMDISYYQHPGNANINFNKMYAAGIRFVIIKGGDTIDAYDAQAVKYMLPDRRAAQAAHLYTSFYYYAYLPNSSNKDVITKDAKAQAQKVIWRIASMGGYGRRDLPVALDLENNCVSYSSGNCAHYASPASVTLWAQTWLDAVAAATNKKPFVYSYPQFLENAMSRSVALRQYPLWLAHYSVDPAVTTNQPNAKTVGCYADSWTNQDCTAQWQIWQYTSCGIAGKYGVPGTRVDLNVFYGNNNDFMKLVRGTWQPDNSQMLPFNEPTAISITAQSARTTADPVLFYVNVVRPDATPVVTGTVAYAPASTLMASGIQTVTRNSSGSWIISLRNLPAGNYVGAINFTDPTGTEAAAQTPVLFTVTQAPTPSATPTPTKPSTPSPTPVPKPKPLPVDSCAGQIRN
jgi:GH25 family lysozyme M1 (1,4-beta-N-acetylmuramidase)